MDNPDSQEQAGKGGKMTKLTLKDYVVMLDALSKPFEWLPWLPYWPEQHGDGQFSKRGTMEFMREKMEATMKLIASIFENLDFLKDCFGLPSSTPDYRVVLGTMRWLVMEFEYADDDKKEWFKEILDEEDEDIRKFFSVQPKRTELILSDEQRALMLADKRPQVYAKRSGRKPETLLMEIEKHLPAEATRIVYLDLLQDPKAPRNLMRPETFARVVQEVLGQDLTLDDLRDWQRLRQALETSAESPTSPVVADFGRVSLVELVRNLSSSATEVGGFQFSVTQAIKLVTHFQHDALEVAQWIVHNLWQFRESYNMEYSITPKVISVAIKKVIDHCRGISPLPEEFESDGLPVA